MTRVGGNTVPVLIVLALLLLVWYVSSIFMNAPWQATLYGRAGTTDVPLLQYLSDVWSQDKPILPAPHQIVEEVWTFTAGQELTSRRSFLYHAGITLSATLLGFVFGKERRPWQRDKWFIAAAALSLLAVVVTFAFAALSVKNAL